MGGQKGGKQRKERWAAGRMRGIGGEERTKANNK